MDDIKHHIDLITRALDLSVMSVRQGGGPFGALIVKNGIIIAEGINQVTEHKDPTAHAEIIAIRKATEKTGHHDLSGHIIYCSCEPCPMCLGAIYWARIDQVFYANSAVTAADYGFDDLYFYQEFAKSSGTRSIPEIKVAVQDPLVGFNAWKEQDNKDYY